VILRSHSGFRRSDAEAVVVAHNEAVMRLMAQPQSPRTALRRLRMLAALILEGANHAFEDDGETTAIEACDAFWARRAAGERDVA